MKRTLFSLHLFVMAGSLAGQAIMPDSLFRFSGTIFSLDDKKVIPNVHILNLSKGTGTVSSYDGSFELYVRDADSLKISCIGFCERYFIINRHLIPENINIYLEKDTILMEELLVYPFGPRRFFKYTFLNLKLPEEKDEYTINPAFTMFKEGEGPAPPAGLVLKGPVQLLYDAFNKKARLQRRLERTRRKYGPYLVPEEGDSLTWPEIIK